MSPGPVVLGWGHHPEGPRTWNPRGVPQGLRAVPRHTHTDVHPHLYTPSHVCGPVCTRVRIHTHASVPPTPLHMCAAALLLTHAPLHVETHPTACSRLPHFHTSPTHPTSVSTQPSPCRTPGTHRDTPSRSPTLPAGSLAAVRGGAGRGLWWPVLPLCVWAESPRLSPCPLAGAARPLVHGGGGEGGRRATGVFSFSAVAA